MSLAIRSAHARPIAPPAASDFAGHRTMTNTLDRAHGVKVTEHDANADIARAAATLGDCNAVAYSMPPKTLAALTTGSKLRDTMYYALLGGYPERGSDGKLTGGLGTKNTTVFQGAAEDQIMTVKKVTAQQLRAALTQQFMPAPDSPDAARRPEVARAIDTVVAALSRRGGALYQTHYEDDTQVYDGFVSVNARTGQLHQFASYTDG